MRACDVKKEMEKFVGGGSFITLNELTRFLNRKDAKSVKKKYLNGLERIDTWYFIPDVVQALIERGRNIA